MCEQKRQLDRRHYFKCRASEACGKGEVVPVASKVGASGKHGAVHRSACVETENCDAKEIGRRLTGGSLDRVSQRCTERPSAQRSHSADHRLGDQRMHDGQLEPLRAGDIGRASLDETFGFESSEIGFWFEGFDDGEIERPGNREEFQGTTTGGRKRSEPLAENVEQLGARRKRSNEPPTPVDELERARLHATQQQLSKIERVPHRPMTEGASSARREWCAGCGLHDRVHVLIRTSGAMQEESRSWW